MALTDSLRLKKRDHRNHVEELLEEARELQSEFWAKLLELEGEIGQEIDANDDLEDIDIDDLIGEDTNG